MASELLTGREAPITTNEMEADEAFGFVLSTLRTKAGISQSKLADLAGIDHSYMSRMENASRMPSREVVEAIVAALELDTVEADRLHASAGFSGKGNTISHTEGEMLALNAFLRNPDATDAEKQYVRSMLAAFVGGIAVRYAKEP